MRCRCSLLRRGLSLAEMLISIPLVGIALVVALNTVGASKVSQFKVSVGREGHLLAQGLMSEILQQDYADVEIAQKVRDDIRAVGSATYTLGPDTYLGRNEPATGDRSLFNDVDDYDGWSASPPQDKDGSEHAGMTGWKRSVSVGYTSAKDLKANLASDFGWKRITVTVTYNDVPAAELVALKAIGLAWLEACCFDDGTCADLRAETCAVQGGTALGPETDCATTDCATGAVILFVVTDDMNPNEQELARKTLMESWDFGVTLIAAAALQSDFDAAVEKADAAYVSDQIVAADLGTKLYGVPIGVVNEQVYLIYAFQFSSGTVFSIGSSYLTVLDNTHYITSVFDVGPVSIHVATQRLIIFGSKIAPGARALGEIGNNNAALATVEVGDTLADGLPAAGRRVEMPWGDGTFDFNGLIADGQTIMKRAIEWAAGLDETCGDSNCTAGEECDCPADCGVPVAFEEPGVTCDDGLDNDCDGFVDCDDIDCPADPACCKAGGTACGAGWECCSGNCDKKGLCK